MRRKIRRVASGNAVYQGAAPLSYAANSGSVTDRTRVVFFEGTAVRAKTEKRTQLPDFRRDGRPPERGREVQWREDSVIMQCFDSSAARVRVSGGRTRATLFGASARRPERKPGGTTGFSPDARVVSADFFPSRIRPTGQDLFAKK